MFDHLRDIPCTWIGMISPTHIHLEHINQNTTQEYQIILRQAVLLLLWAMNTEKRKYKDTWNTDKQKQHKQEVAE